MAQIKLTEEHIYEGSLVLVTPELPLRRHSDEADMERVSGRPDILLRKQAAEALWELLADIGCKDEITAVSGYRTQREQEEIWRDSLAENGEEFTKKFVAVPGHSEHQTGYAVDLAQNTEEIDFICPEFPYTGIYGKFRERMACFGFVERYVAGKEKVTGIGAEPWHFRYVGYPHSAIMAEKDMVMEEYIEFLRRDTGWGHPYIFRDDGKRIEISYISVEKGEPKALELPEQAAYQSAGTNEGGIVLSIWKGSV